MRLKLPWFVVAVVVGTGGCGFDGDAFDLGPPGSDTASDAVVVAEQCRPVTSIEVVHHVNGSNVTDRLRLSDDAAADPSLALRSFQVAGDHFGAANIVSSRVISQVYCFPQQAAIKSIPRPDPPNSSVCVNWSDSWECTDLAPSHVYDYGGTESCSVTNHTDAVTLSCEDSSAIVTRRGDVVLTINTDSLRADIAAKTQVLRRLVGDQNVITNFHFDIVLNPDQQAAIVGNDAFSDVARQIQQASDAGQPLPDVKQILSKLPDPPQNIDFYTQLTKAYQTKLERLKLLAQITNGNLLSPQQVNAIYQNFVVKSRLIDKLDVDHSASALNQAADLINDTINQLATTDPSSTVYRQVRAGAQSLLDTHTSKGIFAPGETLDFVVPDLYESLTARDIDERLQAAQSLIEANEQFRRRGIGGKIDAVKKVLPLLRSAIKNHFNDGVWQLFDQMQATEFFVDNNDPTGTSYDVHLTPDALALFNITAQPNSSIAYEVITLLNTVADYHAETGKVTVDVRAVIILNARSALATDDVARALYHTEEAYGILAFLKNAPPGYLDEVLRDYGATANGIAYTATTPWPDPAALSDHLKAGLANWRQTMDLVLQQGVEVLQRWPNMTPAERADLLGRIAAQVQQTLPAGVTGAGQLDAALREAVRLHLDKAARGLALIERGGVPLAEEAAVELIKRFDHLGITDVGEAVQVADALDDAMPCSIVGLPPLSPVRGAAGSKPPCTVAQIAEAFDRLRVSAQQMGLALDVELSDFAKSTARKPLPGAIVVNLLNLDDQAFAEEVVHAKGGVLVGARAGNAQAIDGFYQGHPVQLTEVTSSDVTSLTTAVQQAEQAATVRGYRQVDVYVRAVGLTRDQVMTYALGGALATITRGGAVHAIDILAANGQWVHIEGGFAL